MWKHIFGFVSHKNKYHIVCCEMVCRMTQNTSRLSMTSSDKTAKQYSCFRFNTFHVLFWIFISITGNLSIRGLIWCIILNLNYGSITIFHICLYFSKIKHIVEMKEIWKRHYTNFRSILKMLPLHYFSSLTWKAWKKIGSII